MLQGVDGLFQLVVFGGEPLDGLFLTGAIVETCCCHPLADTSLGDELLFLLLLIGAHHAVNHAAEGEPYVGHFFILPLLEIGLVIADAIVSATELEHIVVAWMVRSPSHELMNGEVVGVVFLEFLYAGAGHVEQFEFHFHGCYPVGGAFHNVLFARACCLYHLIDSAIAKRWKEALSENHCELIEHRCLLVEPEVLPVGLGA